MSEEIPDEMMWIRTEPSVDGSTYVVTVEIGEDRAIVLTPDNALKYAAAILGHAQRAEYDGAVLLQLRTLGISDPHAVAWVEDLRKDRPPIDDAILKPFGMEPGVNMKGKPFLKLTLEGRDAQWGQWSIPQAREHAMFAVECVIAADLDAQYHRMLTGVIGLEDGSARGAVQGLAEHRWDYEANGE